MPGLKSPRSATGKIIATFEPAECANMKDHYTLSTGNPVSS
jgi:hypothetical protein